MLNFLFFHGSLRISDKFLSLNDYFKEMIMKLKLKKSALKQLDKNQNLPLQQTPQVAGGAEPNTRIPCRLTETLTGTDYGQCRC